MHRSLPHVITYNIVLVNVLRWLFWTMIIFMRSRVNMLYHWQRKFPRRGWHAEDDGSRSINDVHCIVWQHLYFAFAFTLVQHRIYIPSIRKEPLQTWSQSLVALFFKYARSCIRIYFRCNHKVPLERGMLMKRNNYAIVRRSQVVVWTCLAKLFSCHLV